MEKPFSRKKMIGRQKEAWLVACAAFLSRVFQGGLMKSLGVLLITVTEQCGIMVWQYGNTAALMEMVGSVVTIIASPLMTIVSPRYLLIAAGVMIGSGFMLVYIADTWTAISLSLILLTGVGIRSSMVFSISILPKYFDKYYLLACGLAYTGAPFGTIVFAPLSQLLLDTYGWRSTFALLGVIGFNSILCGFMVRSQPYERSDIGNTNCEESERIGNLQRIQKWLDFSLFKEFAFVSLLVSDFCVCIAWQGWVIYLIPHGEEKGLSPYQSSGLAIAGGVGFFIGLLLLPLVVDTGYVSDYQGRTGGFFVLGTTFLMDPLVNSFSGQMILSFTETAAIGLVYTLSMAIVMKISVENVAQVVAFSMFVSAVGQYVGGFLTGLLFDVTGGYTISYMVIGGFQMIAAVFSGLAMVLEHRCA